MTPRPSVVPLRQRPYRRSRPCVRQGLAHNGETRGPRRARHCRTIQTRESEGTNGRPRHKQSPCVPRARTTTSAWWFNSRSKCAACDVSRRNSDRGRSPVVRIRSATVQLRDCVTVWRVHEEDDDPTGQHVNGPRGLTPEYPTLQSSSCHRAAQTPRARRPPLPRC